MKSLALITVIFVAVLWYYQQSDNRMRKLGKVYPDKPLVFVK